jgi:cupin superfamily acireductone dioxygenase involved in methionine salvage
LDGSGYFDVRDEEDVWIRIAMEKGDMIILVSACVCNGVTCGMTNTNISHLVSITALLPMKMILFKH